MDTIIERACKAAFEGDVIELKALLNQNIDINGSSDNWTILHSAIENENLECVNLLIHYGADLEFKGSCDLTPLEHAIDISIDTNNNTGGKIGEESIELIKMLLESGANPKSGIDITNRYGSEKILNLLNSYVEK